MKRKDLEDRGLESDVIDFILAENGKDVNAVRAKLTAAEAEVDRLKDVEAELEELKLADKDDLEKAQLQIERLERQAKEYTIKSNRLDAERAFTKAELDIDANKELIDDLVDEDATKTMARVTRLVELLTREREDARKQAEKDNLDGMNNPPRDPNSPPDPFSAASFAAEHKYL